MSSPQSAPVARSLAMYHDPLASPLAFVEELAHIYFHVRVISINGENMEFHLGQLNSPDQMGSPSAAVSLKNKTLQFLSRRVRPYWRTPARRS